MIQTKFSESFITIDIFNKMKTFKMPKSKSDQPIALDRAHLGSRLHRSRGQSSVLESWRSLGSPQLPGPSFPAYESPPTANRRVHWWGFTTLQDGSRRILPPVRLGGPPFQEKEVDTSYTLKKLQKT